MKEETAHTAPASIDVSQLIPVPIAMDHPDIKSVYRSKSSFAYAMRTRKQTGLNKAIVRVSNVRFIYLPKFREFLATRMEAV